MRNLRTFSLFIIGLLLSTIGLSQNQNPSVTNPTISPSPAIAGQTVTIGFTIGNTGTTAIPGDSPVSRMEFTIQLGSGIELESDPLTMVSGSILNAFDITWFSGSNTFKGIQNTPIPGFSTYNISIQGTAINGIVEAIANIQINADNVGNSTDDDEASIETALPVTLTHFKATSERGLAMLNWATTEEVNSDRFDVLRSFDSKAWHTIGTVRSNGTSSVPNTYQFTDESPANGNNYYRLKMIDLDGSYEMSPIESLTFDIREEITISPNPVVEKINIRTENMAGVEKVELRNSAGLLLYNASNASAIDVQRLPAGLYVISITRTGGRVTSHKVLKQ